MALPGEDRPLKVLIVDDSGAMKTLLARALQKIGCVVAGLAANGAEGVEMYKKLMPDFVTMDIEMPGMNGLDALKGILEHDRGAVVIMVTSVAKKDSVIECVKAGARSYILKPFTPEMVRSSVQKCFPKAELKDA